MYICNNNNLTNKHMHMQSKRKKKEERKNKIVKHAANTIQQRNDRIRSA